MKILVTGGAGYIGSILVPELLRRDHEVAVLDNFMFRQQSLLDVCNNPNLTVIRGDCRDMKHLEKYVPWADAIIPLACLVGAPLCDEKPAEARSIIIDGIKMILELRKSAQKIIYPNTNSGYGIGKTGTSCDENSPLNPISLYGKLKVEAENLVHKSGNSVVFRLATVFGIAPRMRLDLLVNDFVYRAVYDRAVVLFEENFKRNYIHVRDVTAAFVYSLENWEKMKDNVYNLGLSSANLTKKELCQSIQKILPNFSFVVSPIGEDPDKRDYIVSNAKIEATGYLPKVSLEDGIKELVRGYRIIKRNDFANI